MAIRSVRGWMLPGVLLCGVASCNFSEGNGDGRNPGHGAPTYSRDESSTAQDPFVVRVKVVHAQEQGMERRVSRPASVHAFAYADLFANISGYLEKQAVDIGSRVKKGESLARIHTPELWADLDRAKATLKKAEADVRVKEARVQAAKANLEESRIDVEQARADWKAEAATLELRHEQYTRYEKLVKAKAIEAELLDEKREQSKSAEAKEFAARKKIRTKQARVLSFQADVVQTRAELEDAEAEVGVARANLQRAQVMADYTTITAPFAGVITERFFHEGDFIRDASQGSGKNDPLLRIAHTDLMRVIMYVPDPDVPFVKQGQTADLFVDALQGQKFTGKVARLANSEDYRTRTMRTEVDIPNPDNVLRDGMFGTMTIHLGRHKGITVPTPCLTHSEIKGKRAVFVVRDHKAKKIDVEVLADNGIEATIRGQLLRPGDQIAAEHSSGLTDGMRVQPQESHGDEKKE